MFAEQCDEVVYQRVAVEEVNPESAVLLLWRSLAAFRLRRITPGHRFDAAVEDALFNDACRVFGDGLPERLVVLAESWSRRLAEISDAISAEAERSFEDYVFGDPPPSESQFAYAEGLGLPIADGMTKHDFQEAIGEAVDRKKTMEALISFGDELAESRGYARLRGLQAVQRYLIDRYGWPPSEIQQLTFDQYVLLIDGADGVLDNQATTTKRR
ncbi:MAG: hypothetical protein WBC44_19900 [Planctomycetaceae bacterium]